jgi:outer membrane protein
MRMNSIRTVLLGIALSALTVSTLVAQETKTVKVGYTNVELLMNYMPETKAIEKDVTALENKLLVGLQIKQKNFQMELDDLTERVKANLLSPEQITAEETRLMGLQQEIQTDLAKAEQAVLERRLALLEPLEKKIQTAIDAVAVEGGYSYILNQVIGMGVPTIIYGAEDMEVTHEIAKKLGIVVPEEEGSAPPGQ